MKPNPIQSQLLFNAKKSGDFPGKGYRGGGGGDVNFFCILTLG